MRQDRLLGLDLLRGIAAFLVMLLHLDGLYEVPSYFQHADLMVDFFFMLSGFVMARSYEGRIGSEIGACSFTLLRFRRLWLPIAVGVFIGLTLRLAMGYPLRDLAVLALLALLLLPNKILQYDAYDLNPPEWSITSELIANFLHALFLWRLSVKALAVVAMVSAFVLLRWPTVIPGNELLHFWMHNTARILLAYSIGIMIWRIMGDAPRLPLLLGILGLPLAMLAAEFAWPDGNHGNVSIYVPFVILVLPSLLIAGLGVVKNEVLATISRIGGAISFPLYATHHPLIKVIESAHWPKWSAMVIAVGFAALLTILLEKAQDRRGEQAMCESDNGQTQTPKSKGVISALRLLTSKQFSR